MNPTTIKLISLCGQYFVNAFVDRVAEFVESGYWKHPEEVTKDKKLDKEDKDLDKPGVTPKTYRIPKPKKAVK